MKLTGEKVAKALGWKKVIPPGSPYLRWVRPGNHPKDAQALGDGPMHTTNLSLVIWEVERRKLAWRLERAEHYKGVPAIYHANVDKMLGGHMWPHPHQDSPAKALCAALLAYLKEKP